MYFEGPEKKVELTVKESWGSLRQMPFSVWENMVARAGASILSEIKNENCDAYLLSESSLFVYDDYFVMITCGTTTLASGLIEFINLIGKENIAALIYERKNEHFPYYQQSDFFEDVYHLKKIVPGKSWQFGDEDNHHIFLFEMDGFYEPDEDDMTVQILMHGIQGCAKDTFCDPQVNKEKVNNLKITQVFPEFVIDEHFFKPLGYSLNGIKDKWYYTIHVTPQEPGSYVSFETNYFFEDNLQGTVDKIMEIFQPESYDVIISHKYKRDIKESSGYLLRSYVEQQLGSYSVLFKQFYHPPQGPAPAIHL